MKLHEKSILLLLVSLGAVCAVAQGAQLAVTILTSAILALALSGASIAREPARVRVIASRRDKLVRPRISEN